MRSFTHRKNFGGAAFASAMFCVLLMCSSMTAEAESTISNVAGGSATPSSIDRSRVSIVSSRAVDRRDEERRTGLRSERIVRESWSDDYSGFGGSGGRRSTLSVYGNGDFEIVSPGRYALLDNRGWRRFDSPDSHGTSWCLVERSDGVASRRELVPCDVVYGDHVVRNDEYIRGYRQGYRDAYGSNYYIKRSSNHMCEVSTPSGMIFRGFGLTRHEARSRAVNSCAMTYPRWNCDHWSISCSE